jgi:hypothetical protein
VPVYLGAPNVDDLRPATTHINASHPVSQGLPPTLALVEDASGVCAAVSNGRRSCLTTLLQLRNAAKTDPFQRLAERSDLDRPNFDLRTKSCLLA